MLVKQPPSGLAYLASLRNHTVLPSDACHPFLPSGVSGASMAIEDALTLSTLLTPDLHPNQIKERLELYEEIRKPRVGRVRDESRRKAEADGGETKEEREAYMRFLAEHDAVEHAKVALDKHLKGRQ